MLTLGLTGGIGSGKSAVAGLLAGLGAAVVDADVLAREVVAVGTPGLAAVAVAFGPAVLRGDGALDRPALGRLVFADPAARRRLDAIVHPLVSERTRTLFEQAEQAGTPVLVHDVPLLVELGLGPGYHLVVVVDAPVELRLARLADRGLAREQAQARIAAQADEPARRAAADVWLDNAGSREQLATQVQALHTDRLLPYARHLAQRRPATGGRVSRKSSSAEVARLLSRLRHVCGGDTQVLQRDSPDEDGLEVEVTALTQAAVEALVEPLATGGFPPWGEQPGLVRRHGAADPGRPATVLVRATTPLRDEIVTKS